MEMEEKHEIVSLGNGNMDACELISHNDAMMLTSEFTSAGPPTCCACGLCRFTAPQSTSALLPARPLSSPGSATRQARCDRKPAPTPEK
jgi:hypothetical protein